MGEYALLAKPDVALVDHLRQVTRVGRHLAQRMGLSPELTKKVLLACAFHDIGKATNSFQEHVRGRKGKAYPHALASLPFALIAELKATGLPPLASAAVISHHSPLGPDVYQGFGPADYHSELSLVLQTLCEYLQELGLEVIPSVQELVALETESPAGLLNASFDFGDKKQSLRGIYQALPAQEFADVKAVLCLADWLVSAGRQHADSLFCHNGKEAIDTYVSQRGVKLREFQREAEQRQVVRKLYLRAPTGAGKTEALLLWAGNADRLIYLLPTQATVNAMWRRLRSIYGPENVGLAHGRANYMLHKEAEEDPLDARLFASVFAKPVVVATLDQYLLAHLHGRHWEERLALARRATIVLDEIHSYEPYTLGLLLQAPDQEPPARLALASATLPEALIKHFGEATLVEAEAPLWKRQRHHLQLRPGPLLGALDGILHHAKDGKTVLVIANTVDHAQAIYRALRAKVDPQVHLILLHSRFAFRDRQRKEKQLESPRPGTILVSTQVVEVSLDISYDVLFTELAPIDALVQRMGRINRKADKPPAPVFVFEEWSKGSETVYGKDVLCRSAAILAGLPERPTDREMAEAADRLYDQTAAQAAYLEEIQDGRNTLVEVQTALGCYTIDLEDEEMRSKFTARRGHLSIEVLPVAFRDAAYGLIHQGEHWRLVELLVPVPIYWLKNHAEWFSPCRDLECYVVALPYDEDLGLCPPGEGGMPVDTQIL
ncbi:MAG: CRISPR-associated helicase Cas3' [Limnochordales bacterium]|nr:CRISPR-associated helicase Cas3' [Limnochordales bacterium]